MGVLVDGEWQDRWYDTASSGGRFRREESRFRNWITADGSSGFKAEPGRYHLYVSYACPWAHRTLIFRVLKGLEAMIPVTAVEPLMLEEGWTIAEGADPVNGARRLYEVYRKADPQVSGRASTPVLWDIRRQTIVSNESADIIRMFNAAFDGVGARSGDYCPKPLQRDIDAMNERIYEPVNNGVYKAGFATTQEAYEEAVRALFDTLDGLEEHLRRHRWLVGGRLTEADWRLFTTLIRFDAVYHGHFKCNVRRLVDYPNLWAYTRDLYQQPGVAETVKLDQIKRHYYGSHRTINPTAIVPVGPEIDPSAPHDRERIQE